MAYIKMQDVMKICEGYSEHCFNSSDARGQDIADRILDDVVELPTADVEEVKRGEWFNIVSTQRYRCSLCGNEIYFGKDKFCSGCGAKMDGTLKERGEAK